MESEHKVWIAFVIAFAIAITAVISIEVIKSNECVMSFSKDSTRSVEAIKQICR